MIILDTVKGQIPGIEKQLEQLKYSYNYGSLLQTVEELEQISQKEDFWNDLEYSQKILKQMKHAKTILDKLNALTTTLTDIMELLPMAMGENDEELAKEIAADFRALSTEMEKENIAVLLSGEYDKNDAILTFHAGAGGTESQDWAEMLYRMYTRYANKQKFKVKILDYLAGDEAGIKSVSILIEGFNAYGYLKSENGVHRLVRISPFDSSGRRHTSFASLEVLPNIEDDTSIDISPEELKIDTYRSGGAGGQHVNTTDSAVRITHLPTGVVVACQNERSQHKNKDTAMKLLKSKLVQIKVQQNLEKISDIKGVQKEIGWGSQIRSYVFMPYTLVKDHRTGMEKGNVSAVMDGDIEDFITEYLSQKHLGKI